MLDCAACLCQLIARATENQVVGLGVVDLVASSLRTRINAKECDTLPKLAVDATTSFFDIWSYALLAQITPNTGFDTYQAWCQ